MSQAENRSAAVIGGGIGGLAAAIALARAGWEPTVYEAAAEPRPLGAGLSIWPNGTRALRALGLDELVAAAPRTGGAAHRADGSVLTRFSAETIEARYGVPLLGLHRAEILEALLGQLGSERVRFGMRLESCAGGELRFADGSVEPADLIVGADGINSVVRAETVGDGEPVDSGIVAFRGVAHFDGEVPPGEWWGPGTAAGLLPLRGDRVYWYLAFRGEPDPAALQRHVAAFDPRIGEIVGHTPGEEILTHRLYDREPLRRWSRGTTTLLGDAAHPMLPFLGQGACTALEDAVALGEAVASTDGVPAALAAYERARVKRAAAVVAGSRRAARLIMLGSGAGRALRNLLMPLVPESARFRQLDPFIGLPE
ncbi:MAG TPA: FAD-dependent monooxygenase [Solirubrobacterales bacterium]|jgi:2-polyprenyl-6-methoxyphenol hydroxylase-like FAD-dependent oxidoreductase|nr:FAD-dependent monooxygenase [Solirubrobacterales bacterium]